MERRDCPEDRRHHVAGGIAEILQHLEGKANDRAADQRVHPGFHDAALAQAQPHGKVFQKLLHGCRCDKAADKHTEEVGRSGKLIQPRHDTRRRFRIWIGQDSGDRVRPQPVRQRDHAQQNCQDRGAEGSQHAGDDHLDDASLRKGIILFDAEHPEK